MIESTTSTGSFVSHLESAIDGTIYPARTLQTMHEDRPLWVRYDLDAVKAATSRAVIQSRPQTMWRCLELLPVENETDIVTLGETVTPLVRCERLGAHLGLSNLFIKDESRLPTGSFKARGMAMAVTMAKSLGVQRVAVPTAGNAGGALAAYAARAGLACYVFMPADTPLVNRYEAALHGAKVFLVNGLITDCGRIVGQGRERLDWFDISTLKEPYRIEGKKTMGLELAEQFNWKLPDAVFYPTGGGTGLIGMWKAFHELAAIGWLDSTHMPRMYSCQSSGCSPIARAFEDDVRFAEPFENAHTIASGLRVPKAVGDFMILDAVRQSGGSACTADESRILEWMRAACEMEGVSLCPEAATCIGAVEQAVREGTVQPDERVVVFNTGAVQKYVEVMEMCVDLPTLDCGQPIDWDALV